MSRTDREEEETRDKAQVAWITARNDFIAEDVGPLNRYY
jgi:hypothetical protein